MRPFMTAVCAALGGTVLLGAAPAARAEGWGTIKGQVVWAGGAVPAPKQVAVEKDKEHCLSKGPILSEEYVINPRNKGVRWAVVYLIDVNDAKKDLPVHPTLQAPRNKTVELDQPCCRFEPHVLAVREDQTLLVKNSAPIPHNVNLTGGAKGPNLNQILPPAGKMTVEEMAARPTPIQVACNIHPWMKGYIFVRKDPYFAVTDADGNFEIKNAPAGKYRIVIWQEGAGWVVGDPKPSRIGKRIDIKADDTTDLGKIPLKPAD
jgi:hypothetical protein